MDRLPGIDQALPFSIIGRISQLTYEINLS